MNLYKSEKKVQFAIGKYFETLKFLDLGLGLF